MAQRVNIKRFIAPREVKIALSVLDEIGLDFDYSEGFQIVNTEVVPKN